MSSNKRMVRKTFGAALAAIASIVLTGGVHAADASSPAVVNPLDTAQKPVEQIEELAEVWVRGKRLSETIEDAEDDFFVLYNKLNKDNQYDVHCGRMALNRGSMIMVRSCVPGFIVNNYGDIYGNVSYGTGYYGGSSCGGFSQGGYYEGAAYTTYSTYSSCGDAFGYIPPATSFASTVPSAALMTSKRPAYAANVLKVITSDPRLLEKVKGLGVLYKDMELVQGHYVKVKAAAPAREKRKGASPSRGPRVL